MHLKSALFKIRVHVNYKPGIQDFLSGNFVTASEFQIKDKNYSPEETVISYCSVMLCYTLRSVSYGDCPHQINLIGHLLQGSNNDCALSWQKVEVPR